MADINSTESNCPIFSLCPVKRTNNKQMDSQEEIEVLQAGKVQPAAEAWRMFILCHLTARSLSPTRPVLDRRLEASFLGVLHLH
ncbi:hypothetical protein J6590_057824 [Homalodisca vitripennis]|nr:hypothetical protein J6590_057824 [Homalodisca vitripennis]